MQLVVVVLPLLPPISLMRRRVNPRHRLLKKLWVHSFHNSGALRFNYQVDNDVGFLILIAIRNLVENKHIVAISSWDIMMWRDVRMELNNWFLSIGTDWYSATHATCNSMQPPNNEAHLRFAPRVTFGGRSGSRQTKILCFRDLSSICWLTPLEMRPYRRADMIQNAYRYY